MITFANVNFHKGTERSAQNRRKMEMFKRVLQILLFIFFSRVVIALRDGRMPFYVAQQDGDIILVGLFSIHGKTADDECNSVLNPRQLANAEAMVYAIEEINRDPFVLPNRSLGYRILDTCGIPTRANCMAFSLATNNDRHKCFGDTRASKNEITGSIAAVIGPVDSASSIVVANTLEVENLPLISPSATSEELSHSDFRVFFRTVPPDSQQAKAISDMIDYFNWTYVIIVGIDTSYGRFGIHALEHEAEERDTFCIHSIEYYPPDEYKPKIRKIVSRIKKAVNVRVIVLWSDDTPSVGFFFRESLQQQMFGRTWLASDGWSESRSLFATEYSAVIRGFIGTSLEHFDIPSFMRHLLELNSSSPRIEHNMWWREFWRDVNNCSEKAPKGCMRNNVSRLTPAMLPMMKTSSLAYVIDAVRAAALAIDSVHRCPQKQTHVSHIRSTGMLKALRKVRFQGITGAINFNNKGDSLSSATYDIVNLQLVHGSAHSLVKVGTWKRLRKDRLQLRADSVVWNSGGTAIPTSHCREFCKPGTRQPKTVACCWECIPCTIGTISTRQGSTNCTSCRFDENSIHNNTKCEPLPFDNLTLSDTRGIALAIFAIIGVVLTSFTLGVFLKYNETPVVKASIRDLSYLFLASLIVAFLTAIVHVNGPTLYYCFTDMLFTTVVFNSCISILFLKTSYLVYVFNLQRTVVAGRNQSLLYKRKHQLLILGILNATPAALEIVVLAMQPPSVKQMVIPFQYRILQCRIVSADSSSIIELTVYVYELILSIVVAFYAFKARKLPSNFSETKYIAFNMYIQLTTWAVALATFTSLRPGSFKDIVDSIVLLCWAYSFLLCNFAPKLVTIFRYPEKNTSAFVKATVARETLQKSLPDSLNNESLVSLNGKTCSKTDFEGNSSPHTSTPTNFALRRVVHDPSGSKGNIRYAVASPQTAKKLSNLAKQAQNGFSSRPQENAGNSIRVISQNERPMVSFENTVSCVNYRGDGILIRISKDIIREEDSSTESDDAEDTHL